MQLLQLHTTEITDDLPSEIMLLPPSPVIGRDGRSFTYSIEDVLLGWEKHAQKIPIDVDHQSEFGFKTIAVGWIESIYSKEGNLHGKVLWNEEGERLVSKKYYRYISPAFYANEFNEVQYLSSVALTNHPNLKMPSLNNKQIENNQSNNKESIDMNLMLLNKALGIDENASFEVSLNTLMNLREQKIDLNNFVPKADYEVVLNSKNELEAKLKDIETNNLTKEANSMIDTAVKNGQISENSRDFYLDLCINSSKLEEVKSHLNSKQKLTDKIHSNKNQSKPNTHSLSAEEIEVGKRMGHSEEDLIKSKAQLQAGQ